ncbi:Sir2 family NAD-dependent protein deacetylase [Allorhizocola rhizosphaerae]|uniref:Sir2 family NAD-dependent protein deacetylase n=1 Tax=Allorhizocola rhizosphaerae TaxID=1872709 RepID=UPI000E3C795B|nr:Sir2 family NAD-dependent protein deacetylase [Allorhizocola rhizosphaerae]
MTLQTLAELVAGGGVAVLSGAGLSTESGIPDYRGPNARKVTPMTYQAFVGDPLARRRYWARSYVGWRTIGTARPNAGHRAVRQLQDSGLVEGVITQNVDGLHGSAGVIELHGNLARVICLDCGDVSRREALDQRLREANADFDALPGVINPDGDVTLADEEVERFRMVGCVVCKGTLKPDVVFFGETVPRERVQASFGLVERSRLLLVLGSSLHVMSGRRFVLRAAKLGIPVAIVNQGPTRGDHCASLIIDAQLGTILPQLVRAPTLALAS